jgi:hypothetical protein
MAQGHHAEATHHMNEAAKKNATHTASSASNSKKS